MPGSKIKGLAGMAKLRTADFKDGPLKWKQTDSVVGIHVSRSWHMYTGTLINELMSAVERVERKTEELRTDKELHEIYLVQVPMMDGEQILMGAA
jgi:hypothetical protein